MCVSFSASKTAARACLGDGNRRTEPCPVSGREEDGRKESLVKMQICSHRVPVLKKKKHLVTAVTVLFVCCCVCLLCLLFYAETNKIAARETRR